MTRVLPGSLSEHGDSGNTLSSNAVVEHKIRIATDQKIAKRRVLNCKTGKGSGESERGEETAWNKKIRKWKGVWDNEGKAGAARKT